MSEETLTQAKLELPNKEWLIKRVKLVVGTIYFLNGNNHKIASIKDGTHRNPVTQKDDPIKVCVMELC